jgi:NitT/TauT family transport system permease protein
MAFRTYRLVMLPIVLAAIWAFYEGYRWVWEQTGWTRPFPVNERTMPHLHDVVGQLFEPSRRNGPILGGVLLDAALFTAKEAFVGLVIGATVGFLLAVLLVHSAVLARGLMPYIVASQTIPILAIAPMVVVGLGAIDIFGWTPSDWQRVSVIAAYLTFFPVTINSVRGLSAVDPRSLQLMESYAASKWAILWKLRVPTSLPFVFAALKVSATASVVGAIIGELPSSIQEGLGGKILNFNQYYSTVPENLWATNIVAAALGVCFFLAIVGLEKLVVHRAPERFA